MTNTFDILLKQAREKRDATIAHAQREYRQALACITELRKVMGSRPVKTWPDPAPGEPLTLRETMVAVLTGRKLTKVEILVAVREAGYSSKMPRREVHNAVSKILRTDRRFKREGERWTSS